VNTVDEQLLRFLIFSGISLFLIVIAAFLNRKIKLIIALIIVLGVGVFLFNELTLPDRISSRYKENEKLVQSYLEDTYPHSKWTLTYDDSELSDMWGLEYLVVFNDEPNVTYVYTVEDGQVNQAYASSKDEYHDYKYDE
jgi:hypothetical protein